MTSLKRFELFRCIDIDRDAGILQRHFDDPRRIFPNHRVGPHGRRQSDNFFHHSSRKQDWVSASSSIRRQDDTPGTKMSNKSVNGSGLDDRMIDQEQHRAVHVGSKGAYTRLNGCRHSLLVVRVDHRMRYLNGREDCVRVMPEDHDRLLYRGMLDGFEDVLEKSAASKG